MKQLEVKLCLISKYLCIFAIFCVHIIEFMKKTISIIFLLFLLSAISIAQNISISGSVTDESGEPIIGATISPKGNGQGGTVTNIEGKFSLSISTKTKTIVVSYIGMKPVELEIKPVMKIKLFPDDKIINYAARFKPGSGHKGLPAAARTIQRRAVGLDGFQAGMAKRTQKPYFT